MAELFRYTDEDGETVELHVVDQELLVRMKCGVAIRAEAYLSDEAVHLLLDALLSYYGPASLALDGKGV